MPNPRRRRRHPNPPLRHRPLPLRPKEKLPRRARRLGIGGQRGSELSRSAREQSPQHRHFDHRRKRPAGPEIQVGKQVARGRPAWGALPRLHKQRLGAVDVAASKGDGSVDEERIRSKRLISGQFLKTR